MNSLNTLLYTLSCKNRHLLAEIAPWTLEKVYWFRRYCKENVVKKGDFSLECKKVPTVGEIHDEEHSEMWNVFWRCRTLSRRRLRFSRKRGIFSWKRGTFSWKRGMFSWNRTAWCGREVWSSCGGVLWVKGDVLQIMNTAIRSPLNHAIVRAYSQEFYTFFCHICHGFILKWCFSGWYGFAK